MISKRPPRGSSDAKSRRAAQIDLSGLNNEQLLLREHFMLLGRYAFGERWLSPLATALSEKAGRRISVSQVAHWQSGHRPVPPDLAPALRVIAREEVTNLLHRADEIQARWGDLFHSDDDIHFDSLISHLRTVTK